MKYLLLPLLFVAITGNAQNDIASDSTAVRAAIDQLFDGMRQGDSSMVANVFHSDLTMLTTFYNKEGQAASHSGSAKDFKTAVGTPHEHIWDERISDVVIQIDDNVAQAWMNYSFYIGDQFSHCGVNAIQLIRTDDGWKMLHLVDSHRKTDCN